MSVPTPPVDWLEFEDPTDPNHLIRVHLNFFLSNWECLFGKGCQGHFGVQQEHTVPDIGCCTKGAYITSKEDFAKISAEVERLTPEVMGKKGFEYIQKHGWFNMFDKNENPDPEDPDAADDMNGKTRVREGGCVFAIRTGEHPDGRIGCALYHLGQEEKSENDHTQYMPEVCWQLPIGRRYFDEPDTEREITAYVPWDSDYWGGEDDDGTHNSWMAWWCVDTPDAYVSAKPLYRTMESELRTMMGDVQYDRMVELIQERAGNYVSPAAGMVRNEGRPMLPLLVGNRTPRNG